MASFALLIPFPGRFAYGIVLVITMTVEMFSIILFRRFMRFLHLEKMLSVLVAVLLISESIIIGQLLYFFSPVMALVLSFDIYFPAASAFVISSMFTIPEGKASQELLAVAKTSSVFDLFSLVIFAVRDIFGYGTLSFPSSTGIDEIVIFPASESSLHPGIFWATVPGALILCMLFLRIILWIQTNITLAGMKQEVENE